MDDAFETVFFGAFFAVAVYFVYRSIRHAGFKAAMFGARIDRTVGEVNGEKRGPMSVALKVHDMHDSHPGDAWHTGPA